MEIPKELSKIFTEDHFKKLPKSIGTSKFRG